MLVATGVWSGSGFTVMPYLASTSLSAGSRVAPTAVRWTKRWICGSSLLRLKQGSLCLLRRGRGILHLVDRDHFQRDEQRDDQTDDVDQPVLKPGHA